MKLLLSTTKRINTSKWVCYACRKHNSIRGIVTNARGLTPAEQLRKDIGPARTRFAPSPTGYLHLGSLRTALFNYLIAKATGGQFLLRIEDTDQKRTVPDAEERLFRDLEWAGIQWDEGPKVGGPCGPYHQSQRTALYRAHAEQLLESGHAYRCFCTSAELTAAAEFQVSKNLAPDYNRKCYHHVSKEESDDRASKGEAHVIRLLSPNEPPVLIDLVYGVVRQPTKRKQKYLSQGLYDDAILLKSDGFPTYHLANVVDDHLMKITHVIRGSEWMSSTPKHLALYQAFGWEPPAFAHVALLLGEDRQKLSKRQASTNLDELRVSGIFPETLTNFVALLGWSHGAGNDVMSMEKLIKNASMKYTRGDVVVTPAKLWYLQKRHAAHYASIPPSNMTNPSHSLPHLALTPILRLLETASTTTPSQYATYTLLPPSSRTPYISTLLYADAKSMNYTTPSAFLARNIFFFRAPSTEELENSFPSLKLRNVPARIGREVDVEKLLRCMDQFEDVEEGNWNVEELRAWVEAVIEQGAVGSVGSKRFLGEMKPKPKVKNATVTVTESEIVDVEGKENGDVDVDGDGKGEEEYDPDWKEKHEAAREEVKAMARKAWAKVVHGYIRWAIVGGMPGPDGAETMRILGRRECLERLERAREVVVGRLENEGAGSLDG